MHTSNDLALSSFSLPMSEVTLCKSLDELDPTMPWQIQGIASTGSLDQQGEVVLVKGLDLTYLDQGKGTFNWNHYGDKDPSSVIGLINEHSRTDEGELFVKGKLLKHLPKAQAAYNLMKALDAEGDARRMGMSIEGKVLHRQNKVIYKAWVKAVALTMDPVNPDTYVSFGKSFSGAEYVPEEESWMSSIDANTLERALSIASTGAEGMPARSMLSMEALESAVKDQGFDARKSKVREKISKGYTFDEAVARLKALTPTISDDLAAGIVKLSFRTKHGA